MSSSASTRRSSISASPYVSPQIWAWRQGRVRQIGRACDLVLCLLPFETAFYSRHGVAATFVGHPLADQIPLEVDREGARVALGLDSSATFVALLPGSRVGEVERLGTDFLQAAAWLHERRPELRFIAPMATGRAREAFERKQAEVPAAPPVLLIEGRAQQALAACDAAIVASGTATLETLLSRRPMVVAYRLGALTAFLLRRLRLVKVPYFSQPNLLVGRPLVPELLQEQVSGSALGEALLGRLSDQSYLRELDQAFRSVHETLRGGAAARAAQAILELLRHRERQERPA
jgi:lipid-A-disaccharide synthase